MTTRLMIDLETLGVSSTAAVLSIGLVSFDRTSILREAAFNLEVEVQTRKLGRTIDMATLEWWMGQSEAARIVFQETTRLAPVQALVEVSRFMAEEGDPADLDIWCNGASFDFPILRGLFEAFGQEVPWRFYNERCFRTEKNRHCLIAPPVRTGTAHNALADARYQAEFLIAMEKAQRLDRPEPVEVAPRPPPGFLDGVYKPAAQRVGASGIDVAATAGRNS